jgi:beta-xylosidase
MGVKKLSKVSITTVFAVAGLATFGLADNPISTYHYLADPSAASDGDTFYILTDTDDMCVSSDPFNYDIVGLYAFTSKDMKNWTDHGLIFRSMREFDSYPGNTWASGIAVKNGKVYIVYPDGASGVGMITAPSIDGPYTDPIAESYSGKNKIAASSWNAGASVLNGCDDIDHCFDPGIFFDDDGTGYVIFGGGSKDSQKRPIGNNFDIVKFTDNNGKITIDANSLTRIQAPGSFEAPYLHKYKNKYYLSFNNDKQIIDYGMSSSVTGPYTYIGEVIPAIWQVPDAGGHGGNNHQGFAEFQGKWYAVYHDRRLVSATEHPVSCSTKEGCVANPEPGNHRSVSIDELTWTNDRMNTLTFTNAGPKQIQNFDPYQTYKALTSSKQRNVRSRTDWTKGKPVKHVLTPWASKESWIRVSGVDFGGGAKSFQVVAASVDNGNKIEVRKGSASGTLAGTCNLQKTNGWQDYVENSCDMSGLSGVVDELFIVFKGSKDSTMGVLEWGFTCNGTSCGTTEAKKQSPYNGIAAEIPGRVDAEYYDVPGSGYANKSYNDDNENEGNANFRTDEGVDVVLVDADDATKGMALGYTNEGEWLEYTINVKTAGKFKMSVNAASSSKGASVAFSIDGKDVGETVMVDSTGANWSVYENFDVGEVELTAGTHEVRLTIMGNYTNVDYFKFESVGSDGKVIEIDDTVPPTNSTPTNTTDKTDSTKKDSGKKGETAPEAIFGNHLSMGLGATTTFEVFDLKGNKIATFSAKSMAEAARLWKNGNVKGDVRVSGINIIRNRANGMVTKVRINK